MQNLLLCWKFTGFILTAAREHVQSRENRRCFVGDEIRQWEVVETPRPSQELPLAVFREPRCFCTWTSSLFSLTQQSDDRRCSGNDTAAANVTAPSQQDHFQVYHTPVLGETHTLCRSPPVDFAWELDERSLTCFSLASKSNFQTTLLSLQSVCQTCL